MTMTGTVRAAAVLAAPEFLDRAVANLAVRIRAKFMIDSAGHHARPHVAHLVLHDPASRTEVGA